MNLARRTALSATLGFALSAGGIAAELSVEVGGASMVPSKTIVENVVASKDHTIFVTAIETAGLVEMLQSEGPFTVFAPANKAFDKLPKGTVATLLEPDSREKLVSILTYHVIAGRFSAADLVVAAEKGGGTAKFKTVQGEDLVVAHDGRKLEVFDAKGGKAIVTIPDVNQKNGVVHVVDNVLQPKG